MKTVTLLAIMFALCWAFVWLIVVVAEEILGWRNLTRRSTLILCGGLAVWVLFGLSVAVFTDPAVGALW